MKKIFQISAAVALALAAAFAPASGLSKTENDKNTKQMKTDKIKLAIKGGRTFTATLADNSSARALMELLEKGDISIEMEDYARMEKVGPLGANLPRNDERISTGPGDLILYQGRNLVIYYAPNSWNFTRLGKIDNAMRDDLVSALGTGNVTVTLSACR